MPQRKVSTPPPRPLLIFDGDCNFCRFWVERWRVACRDWFEARSSQEVGANWPEIPATDFQEAVQLIDADGSVYSGADAVLRLMQNAGPLEKALCLGAAIPGAMLAARLAYRVVAHHRMFFSWLTRLVWGRDPAPSTFAISRRIFAHGLGVIFLCAFLSLAVQMRGLIGSHGISPSADFLPAVEEQLGTAGYLRIPTIFWLGHNDGALWAGCLAGLALSAALTAGLCPGFCALACWGLYLSFCSVGSPFFDFQWDILLLETALLAALYLPWKLRPAWNSSGPRFGRWLLWWLIFRLMLESGVVKLTSGDDHWSRLTALDYHFETQPLPLWTAWYAHHSPLWMHRCETAFVFLVELAAPFLIFFPRRLRRFGAWAMIALQVGILLTGNYAFFNWLTMLLCLPLLDDAFWQNHFRRWFKKASPLRLPSRREDALEWALGPVALAIVLLTGTELIGSFGSRVSWPEPVSVLIEPLRSFNSYGLFRVMTLERPEIIVEGSDDGVNWRAYAFRWKPGDIHNRPALVAPHQPRLDWQMWFAALGSYQQNRWFISFLARLLEGSPDVLALLEENPFERKPPKYVRALLYQYHFSDPGSGPAWWKRELVGPYCPVLSRREAAESP